MRATAVAFYLSLAVSVVTQAVALSSRQLWMLFPGLIFALVWAFDFWLGKQRLGTLSFLALIAMVFGGFWMKLSGLLLLASAVTALMAWDLDGLSKQMRPFDPDQGFTPAVRAHLGRLLAVAAAGYVLGALPLLVKTSLNLPVAIFLGLLLIIGLSQAVNYLRRF